MGRVNVKWGKLRDRVTVKNRTYTYIYIYLKIIALKHFLMKIREDYYRCVKGKFFFIRQKVCFINILLAFT